VPAHAFVVGNPARQIGWACTCGERLSDTLTCNACGRGFQVLDNRASRPSLRETTSPAEGARPATQGPGL